MLNLMQLLIGGIGKALGSNSGGANFFRQALAPQPAPTPVPQQQSSQKQSKPDSSDLVAEDTGGSSGGMTIRELSASNFINPFTGDIDVDGYLHYKNERPRPYSPNRPLLFDGLHSPVKPMQPKTAEDILMLKRHEMLPQIKQNALAEQEGMRKSIQSRLISMLLNGL